MRVRAQPLGARRRSGPSGARAHVLLLTEGTYPYVLGGVSSWCQLLLDGTPEIDWSVLPVVAGNRRPDPMFEIPANVSVRTPIELWSLRHHRRSNARSAAGVEAETLPSRLLVGLLSWEPDSQATLDALVWCRRHAEQVRRIFHSGAAWRRYLDELVRLMNDDPSHLDRPLDHFDAAQLYQTLYWVARTAATPTPDCDVLHVTAAGWCALPAIVHRALHGTPLLLTEHGLYVREAYLGSILAGTSGGERFIRTRLARGLARLAYASADVFAPVSDYNARWEMANGARPERIQVVPNGVLVEDDPTPLPGNRTVVSIGRIDPLKDVMTMLRTADEVLRRRPDVTFLHYGPVSPDQETYARACHLLHRELGLGDRFRFMGPTRDPAGTVRAADLALLTSISEGMPLALLEAMAQARPIVATSVGGVPEVVRGCGLLAPPGHIERLAAGICSLMDDPDLAQTLGSRGRARVVRHFHRDAQLATYRTLLRDLTAGAETPLHASEVA